ncbi:hypothetical protein [Capnocytophaga gingivalis]|jgi:hypothetical protein|uniref:hypothetical protein n=1 Tax=Capnocytophaga gingivalis TaxID=1017 RepID=UPI0023F2F0E9|nr:hypothetical protein [Capnocytophaga gingivalis]
MNTDIFTLISIFLPYAIIGVILYFVAIRKNSFEERVAKYVPYHSLDKERKQYLETVEKYKHNICIGIKILLILPLSAFLIPLFIMTSKQKNDFQIEEFALFFLLFSFFILLYYLLSYVAKKNAKAQHLLLEEMSDNDFHYLLEVQKSLSWLRKYFPFFILCKKKIYFLTFFTIKELDPKQIKKIRFWNSRRGNRTILIKSSRWFVTTMTEIVYPYLRDIVQKYNPTVNIE